MSNDLAVYETNLSEFFSRIDPSKFILVNCPVCDSKTSHEMFKKGTMHVHKCICGMTYNKRQADKVYLAEFYNKSTAMTVWANLKKKDTKRQLEKFGSAFEFIDLHKPKSILDVGCGAGAFLELCKDRFDGVELLGIDPNGAALEVAQDRGVNVKPVDISEINSKFDLITAWGVLEHVTNPKRLIQQMKERLNPGGHIIVCVPNVNSEVFVTLREKTFSYCPQHLWYFNAYTLRAIFETQGMIPNFFRTIEPESKPILKYKAGFNPYNDLPDWATLEYVRKSQVERLDREIISESKGYKMVVAYKGAK